MSRLKKTVTALGMIAVGVVVQCGDSDDDDDEEEERQSGVVLRSSVENVIFTDGRNANIMATGPALERGRPRADL